MKTTILDNMNEMLNTNRRILLYTCFKLFIKKLALPDVGTIGYFVDIENVVSGVELEYPRTVTKSHLDPKEDKKSWFDYNMVVGTSYMEDRFNCEGYYYFITEDEYKLFKDIYLPIFDI